MPQPFDIKEARRAGADRANTTDTLDLADMLSTIGDAYAALPDSATAEDYHAASMKLRYLHSMLVSAGVTA